MNVFEKIIVSMVLLLFPIFCYLFYVVANKNIDEKHRDLALKFAVVSMFYFITKFATTPLYAILLLSIPISISYKRGYQLVTYALILAAIMIYRNNIYLILILSSFILMLIFNRKRSVKRYGLILMLSSIGSIFLLDSHNLFYNLAQVVPYIALLQLVYYTVKKGEEMIDYHIEYNDLKKEHEIRSSLFKITHEIKNPLAVCKAYIDMFDYNNIECAKKYVPIISGEIDKLLILLQDFLLVNKDNIKFDIMDVNVLLEDIVTSMHELNKFDIELKTLDDEIFINGDYNRLTQVMMNLIKNSFEAHADKVLVQLSVEDADVTIEVIDNGDGISEVDKDKIYEPFYTTKKEGTGLGVSLSKEIVEAHNGSLKYINNPKGTTAKIQLPICSI